MKKLSKILAAIMLVTMLCMTVATISMAADATTAAPNPSTYKGNGSTNVNGITNIGNQIITIVSTVGSIASVIVLVILGLKYMMGSAEEKAEYKKTLMPYIIGAGLVFAASSIAGIIFSFTQGLGGAA